MSDLLTKRPIGHDEASESLRRFENVFWRKDAEGPRASIPANPDRDDDLILHAYIEQQRAKDAERHRADQAVLWQGPR